MGRRRQFTDLQILEVARACFLEHGPSVSTQVIADELGVSQAALFKRFGTKEELLLSALTPPQRLEWVGLVQAGPTDEPLREQLVVIAQAVSRFFEQLIPQLVCLSGSGVPREQIFDRYEVPPPVMANRVLAAWFRRAAEQGRLRVPEPEALAMSFLGSLHIRAFLKHLVGGQLTMYTAEDYAEHLVDTLWAGIRPDGEGA